MFSPALLLIWILNNWFFMIVHDSSAAGLSVRVKEDPSCPDEEAFSENVSANITEDSVTIEFTTSDVTHVTSFWYFPKEVHLLRVTVLGEQERGDPPVQILCFAIHQPNTELLAPTSVARLRQKNPGIVKWAEEDRGIERRIFEMALAPEFAGKLLSPHGEKLCSEASFGVFLTESDYISVHGDSNGEDDPQSSDIQKLQTASIGRCKTVTSLRQACQCELSVCIPWYPCGWKLCRSKNIHGSNDDQIGGTYKCGIKSCRVCYSLYYEANHKIRCMWDN